MPRVSRKSLQCDFVHVMVQGINKEYIFENECDKKHYLRYIFEYKQQFEVELIAYCIMDNHAHLLLYAPQVENLGKYMKKCNEKFSNYYNKKLGRVGVLFRNRYQSEALYDDIYVKNCIKYIHNNPVKAGMVAQAKDYPFSSYNDFVLKRRSGVNFVLERYKKRFDLNELVELSNRKVFIDIEEDKRHITNDDKINTGILDFLESYKTNLVTIISDKKMIKNLIGYLISEYHIQRKEVLAFFGITRYLYNCM